jgi:hypothetical protein
MPSDPLPTAFFGTSFTQDVEKFTIFKTNLIPPVGLTPTYQFIPALVNGAESIFLALLLKVQRSQDQSQDSQLVITPFEMSLEYRFQKWQRKYVCQIEVYQDDTISTYPNPNLI